MYWTDVKAAQTDPMAMYYKDKISKLVNSSLVYEYTMPNSGVERYNYILRFNAEAEGPQPPLGFNRIALAQWWLSGFPSCCGILISHASSVHPAFRKRGIGTLLNEFKIQMAKRAGYGQLMCTDIAANAPERALLKKMKWQDIHSFKNPRTKNDIFISTIDLTAIPAMEYPKVT